MDRAAENIGSAYDVATGDHTVYIRVYGLAGMANCLCLRDFIERMLELGHRFFVVDLADCTAMDSTFMGVLAGTAAYDGGEGRVTVVVANAAPKLAGLLEEVGVSELVFVYKKPFKAPELAFVRLEEQPSEEDRLAMIKSTHEHLIKSSKNNEQVFGPLMTILDAEMRKRGMG